jgi:transcriptional regulator with XRE-family HTH domain
MNSCYIISTETHHLIMLANVAAAPDTSMVLGKATIRAALELRLSNAALARVIGLSEPSISRVANGARGIDPLSKEGQLALLLVRLYRSLDPLVGSDPQKRHDWLRSHNKALNGTPAALIESPYGLVTTLAYLDGMRAAA